MKDQTKQKERVDLLTGFYQEKGRMPSFSEMAILWGLKSKNAVSKVVAGLEEVGIIERDHKGKLIAKSISSPLRMLGTVAAGFPTPAEEELADCISLDEMLIHNRDSSFLLKVSGDSMSGAGILPDDMVIVDKGCTPKSGDIVIAEVDGEWTMKYLRKRGNEVSLVPANSKYKIIYPENELRIAGVVTSVVRQYKSSR
ncbi:MAG: transcriptional repressor LexA [Deltaproteobacteria bacterium]|nr:transcriptional repressor LexA [Deltaproteobacteria bacterium]